MNKITKETIKKYVQTLKERGEVDIVIKTKLSSIEKYIDWAHEQGLISQPNFEQIKNEIAEINCHPDQSDGGRSVEGSLDFARDDKKPQFTSPLLRGVASLACRGILLLKKFLPTIGHWPIGYSSYEEEKSKLTTQDSRLKTSLDWGIQQYVAITMLLIFVSALGAGLYNQFFKKPPTPFAYPTSLTKGTRTLSFQGRLTDNLGNPITTATNLQFRLYSTSTGATSPNLYESGTCSITPDQDGIFSTLIGQDCGSEIGSGVFSENANVYLGVKVGSDAEMSPRQQIANVGYAMNSETLQGFPAGTGSTVPFIPYFDTTGMMQVTTTNPSIQSTSGIFTVQGVALTLASSAGNITLSPTGGNVGVGTTVAKSKLAVSGGLGIGTTALNSVYTTVATAPDGGMIVEGNIGIGTTNPGAQLEIYDTNSPVTIFKGNASNTFIDVDNIATDGDPGIRFLLSGSSQFVMGVDDSDSDKLKIDSGALVGGGTLLTITSGGNVGIGTTNPMDKLDILGAVGIGYSYANAFPSGVSLAVLGNTAIGTTSPGEELTVIGSGSQIKFGDANTDAATAELYSGTSYYGFMDGDGAVSLAILQSNGNLGIGSTNPGAKLEVNGSIKIPLQNNDYVGASTSNGMLFDGTGNYNLSLNSATGIGLIFESDAGNTKDFFIGTGTSDPDTATQLLTIKQSGNVGIGNTNPVALLHVGSGGTPGVASTGDAYIQNDLEVDGVLYTDGGIDTTFTAGAAVFAGTNGVLTQDAPNYFYDDTNNFLGVGTSSPQARLHVRGIGATTNWAFHIDDSAGTDRLTVLDNGNMGIGTTGPAVSLDIVGTYYSTRLDQSQTTNDSIWNSAIEGQSFTPGVTGLFMYADVKIETGGAPGNTDFTLRSGEDIAGTVLATSTSITDLGSNWYRITFDSTPTLTSGQQYTIRYDRSTAYDWLDKNGSVYAGGRFYAAGAWKTEDAAFKTYMYAPDDTIADSVRMIHSSTAATSGSVLNISAAGTTGSYALKVNDDGTFTDPSSFVINDTGNVGIGNTNPQAKLHVQGAGTGQTWAFHIEDSAGTDRLVIFDNGNVGIGNTNPLGILHVGNSTSPALYVASTAGNVGIGTSNPLNPLHVENNPAAALVRLKNTNASGWTAIDMYDDANNLAAYMGFGNGSVTNFPDMAYFGTGVAQPLTLVTNGSRRMTINSTGNIGIGNTNPLARLHVQGAGTGQTWAFHIEDSAGTDRLVIYDNGNVGIGITAPTGAFQVGSSPTAPVLYAASLTGNVGIGITGPSYKLDVAGAISMHDENQDLDARYYEGTFLRGWSSFASGSESNISYVTDSSAPGNQAIEVSTYVWGRGPKLPLDRTQNYEIEMWVQRKTAGTAGTFYIDVAEYDFNGTNINGDGTDWHYPTSFDISTLTTGTWYKYRYVVGPYGGSKDHSSAARYISLGFIANYSSGTDTIRMTGFKIRPITRYPGDSLTITNGGNIGVGNTTPVALLHVGSGGTPGVASTGDAYIQNDLEVDGVLYTDGGIDTTFTQGAAVFAGANGVLTQDAPNFFYDDTNNLLGIGSSSPQASLHVRGRGTGQTWAFHIDDSAGTDRLVVFDNGNVGIGTSNPSNGKLVIAGGGTATTQIYISNPGNDGAGHGAIDVNNGDIIGLNQLYFDDMGEGIRWATSNSSASTLVQIYATDTTPSHLILDPNVNSNAGNVGIGTTGPNSKLAVAGGVAIGTTSMSSTFHRLGVAPDGGLIVEKNVGIGTTNPTGAFHVGSSQTTPVLFVSSLTGNVGIGTTGSSNKLDVNGSLITNSYIGAGADTASAQYGANSARGINIIHTAGPSTGTGSVGVRSEITRTSAATATTPNAAYYGAANINVGSSTVTDNAGFWAAAPTITAGTMTNYYGIYIDGITQATNNYGVYTGGTTKSYFGGNVGIGTTLPLGKLDVRDGNLVLSDADITQPATDEAGSATYGYVGPYSATSGGLLGYGFSDTDALGLALLGTIGSTNPTDSTPAILLSGRKSNGSTNVAVLGDAETVLQIRNYSTNLVTVLGGGNVGIGTTNPLGLLSVGTNHTSPYLFVATSGNGGNVGIGTTGPTNKTEIYESRTDTPLNTVLKLGGYLNAIEEGAFMDFNLRWTGAFPNWIGGRIGSVYETRSSGNNRTALVFYTNDSNDAAQGTAGTSEKLRIQGDGNVGIGISAPTGLLHVGNSTSPALYVASAAGNVGIGTSNPVDKIQLRNWGTGNQLGIRFNDPTNDAYGGRIYFDDTTNTFRFITINDEVETQSIVVDRTSGNVGIGHSTPTSFALEVAGSIGPSATTSYDLGSATRVWSNLYVGQVCFDGSSDCITSNPVDGTGTANYLSKWSDSDTLANALIYDTGTNVGIGTTNPLGLFTVAGNSAPTIQLDTANASGGFLMRSSKGTLLSPSATAADDDILTIGGRGHDGSNYSGGTRAIMRMRAAELFGTSAQGTYITFETTGVGTTSRSEKLRIAADGNVGIGTTNPGTKLDIRYADNSTGYLINVGNSVGNYGGLGLTNATSPYWLTLQGAGSIGLLFKVNTNTNAMAIDTNGNVGIGTTGPQAKLDVYGSVMISTGSTGIFYNQNAGVAQIQLNSAGSNYGKIQNDGTGIWSLGYGATSGSALGTPVVTWNTSGNLGIGTTNPIEKLHIFNSSGDTGTYTLYTNTTTGQTSSDGFAVGLSSAEAALLWNLENSAMQFATNNLERMRIAADGNVGIGITNPTGVFQVGSNTSAPVLFAASLTGNLGVGITNPTQKFDVSNGMIALSGADSTVTHGLIINRGVGMTSTGTQSIIFTQVNGIGGNSEALVFSADNFKFQNYDGSDEFTIRAGNVGIGNTNPLARLHVQGAGTGQTWAFHIEDSAGTDRLVIYDNGNVGIGTTNPLGIFQVGANTTSPFFFINSSTGNLGIGTTNASSPFTFTSTVGTGNIFSLTDNSLTSGTLLSLASTGTGLTSGGMMNINWNPGSTTTTTGDLFSINIGSSANAGNIFNITDTNSSIFSVSENAVTSAVPANFTSSGDVSIAYDINFTNPTASYIKSNAPLYIQAGKVYNSSDLTLRTYNSGDLVFDLAGGATFTQAQAWDLADSSTTSLNMESGLLNLDTTNSRVGVGTTAPEAKLHVRGTGTGQTWAFHVDDSAGTDRMVIYDNGNVGIGITAPTGVFQVGSNSSAPVLYVTSLTGNVGIGRTGVATGRRLQLANGGIGLDGGVTGIGDAGNGGVLYLKNSDNAWWIGHTTAENIEFVGSGTGDRSWKFMDTTSERMRIVMATGNVGIGNSNPQAKFHVQGRGTGQTWAFHIEDSANTDRLVIFDNGNVGIGITAPTGVFQVGSNSSAPVIFVSSLTGNLGIGNTNPLELLHIGNSGGASNIKLQSNGGGSYIDFDSTSTDMRIGHQNDVDRFQIWNATDATKITTFLSGGNVGVGSTNPTAAMFSVGPTHQFQVSSTGAITTDSTAAINSYLQVGSTTTTTYSRFGSNTSGQGLSGAGDLLVLDLEVDGVLYTDGGIDTTFTAGAAVFAGTNGVLAQDAPNYFYDDTNNILGIGTSSPQASLHVRGRGTGQTWAFHIEDSAGTDRLVIFDNGNVGIGITAPTGVFQVGSNSSAPVLFVSSLTGTANIGIGITNPGQKLTIAGSNTSTDVNLRLGVSSDRYWDVTNYAYNATYGYSLGFKYYNDAAALLYLGGNTTLGIGNTQPLGLLSVGTNYTSPSLFVHSTTGNVGIGTTLAGQPLSVYSAAAAQAQFFGYSLIGGANANNGSILIGTTAATLGGYIDYNQNGTSVMRISNKYEGNSASAIQLGFGNSTNVMHLTQGGNVGISNTNPLARLHVQGAGTGQTWAFHIEDSAGTDRLVVFDNGNVGIGITNPVGNLHVAGSTIIFGAGEGGTPTATTIRGAGATGTNVAGANLSFDASNGTGGGGSGSMLFRTAGTNPSVTLDVGSSASVGTGASSLSWSHTVTSGGSNRLLTITMGYNWAGFVTSVTYGGQSLTEAVNNTASGMCKNAIWYLVNPPTGANTATVVLDTNSPYLSAVSASWLNVNQTSPIGATATGTDYNVNVSSNSLEKVIDAVCRNDSTATTAGAGQTELINTDNGGRRAASYESGSTTTTMSWSAGKAIVAAAIQASTETQATTLTERLRIDQNGNVGIGWSTPYGLLHVGDSTSPAFFVSSGTGNVGIGTTNPGAKLHINTTGSADAQQFITASGTGEARIYFDANDGSLSGGTYGSVGHLNDLSVALANHANYPIYFQTNGSTKMTIKGDGNVGIGITAPTGPFQVGSNSSAPVLFVSSLTGNVGIGTSSPGMKLEVVGPTSGTIASIGSDNGYFQIDAYGSISDSNSDVVVNDSMEVYNATLLASRSGNVGVGFTTITPQARLHVRGIGTTTNWAFHVDDNAGTDRLVVLDNGNLGIGITAPTGPFQVGSNSSAPVIYATSLTGNVGIGKSGAAQKMEIMGDGARLRVSAASNPSAYYFDVEQNYNAANTINMYGNGDNFLRYIYNNHSVSLQPANSYNAGVGLTSPEARFHIRGVGTGQTWAFHVDDSAGTDRMVIFDNGNMGIGNTNPLGLLSVGTNHTSPSIFVHSTTGNVGIGTTSPATLLEAQGSSSPGIAINTTSATDKRALLRFSQSNTTLWEVGSDMNQANVNNLHFRESADGSKIRLTLQNGGNVGVGTTNPLGIFQVGANTTSPFLFINSSTGNLGIGTTNASSPFTFTSTVGTGNIFSLTDNSLTTGTLLSLASTGSLTTGGMMNLNWNPGSTSTTTGDLFSINIGSSGNAGNIFNITDTNSSIFSVSENAVTSAIPANFTSSGDVSIAYDINFTNPTASYIKSQAPLYIQAGETFGSSDLTLRTYNSGDLVLDLAGGATFSQAQAWDLADSSTTSLNLESGLLNLDTTNSRVGVGNTAPQARLHVRGTGTGQTWAFHVDDSAGTDRMVIFDNGNVGIGTTNPGNRLEVIGAAGANSRSIVASSGVGGTGYSGSLIFRSSYNNTGNMYDAARLSVYGPTGGYENTTNYLGFDTATGEDTWSTKMAITLVGNVGMGTTNPTAKLDVIKADGTGIRTLSNSNSSYAAIGIGRTGTEGVIGIAGSGGQFATDAAAGDIVMRTDLTGQRLIFTNGASAAALTINGGNVGVGSTGGQAQLHVRGIGTTTNWAFHIDDSAGTDRLTVLDNGNVGIGITAPTGVFQVGSNSSAPVIYAASLTGNVGIGITGPGKKLEVFGGTFDGTTNEHIRTSVLYSGSYHTVGMGVAGGSTNWGINLFADGNKVFTVDTNKGVMIGSNYIDSVAPNDGLIVEGNVGFGTTNPLGKLHVAGNTIVLGVGESGTPTATTIRGAAAAGSNIAGANLTFDASNGTGSGGSGSLIFRTASSASTTSTITLGTTTSAPGILDAGTKDFSFSHTVSSGDNRLLVVGFSILGEGLSANSVTWTISGVSQNLTNPTNNRQPASNYSSAEIWYLASPSAGTGTIKVTANGGNTRVTVGAINFTGVHQTTPLANSTAYGLGSTANSVTAIVYGVPTGSGQWTIDTVSAASTLSASGPTQLVNLSNSGDQVAMGYTNPGQSSHSWTLGGAQAWGIVAMSLVPAGITPNTLAERVRIAPDGNVGIGDSSPDYKLDVWGTICQDTDSNDTCDGTVTSDQRLKTNIAEISNAVDKLTQLRGVYFDWDETNSATEHLGRGTRQVGLIAQEVEQIFPSLVYSDMDGYKMIDYQKLTGPIIQAIKEQQVSINNITTQLAELELDSTDINTTLALQDSQIASLSAQITTIDNRLSTIDQRLSTNALGIGVSAPTVESGKVIDTATGAYLSVGGVWTNTSDENLKENFTALNDEDILEKIGQLDISQWNYKKEDNSVKHIGPTAQNFFKVFGLGGSDKNISTIDPAGIALAGIKGLVSRVSSLASQVSNLTTRVSNLEDNKVISPISETITTNTIKPQGDDVTIDLSATGDATKKSADAKTSATWDAASETSGGNPPEQEGFASSSKGSLAKLIIKGLDGKTAASIDAAGNATFSGTITSETALIAPIAQISQINANEATVSGTLTAERVEAENITTLEQDVNELTTQNSELTTNINDIQALLAKIKEEPLPTAENYQNLDSSMINNNVSVIPTAVEGSLLRDSSTPTLTARNDILEQLTVSGNANMYNITAAGSILAGDILIKENSILSLSWELKLSALSTVSFFDGTVTIAKDGTITTKGELIAEGGIKTNTITINSNTPNLPNNPNNPKLSINNPLGEEVASIDASGSARFNSLALNKYLEATSSASIVAAPDNFDKNGIFAPAIETTTQTAGIGIVPENTSEIIIYNDTITKDSLVYLTPTSQIAQTSLTVLEKEDCSAQNSELTTHNQPTCRPYFKVSPSSPSPAPIQFNWLIIN